MKLRINENKTKEIIFWKSDRTKNKHDIPLIPGIERIESTKLLGVILTSNLSWTPHINNILNICCQRFYLLNRLKHMSLCNTGLNLMFRSLVVSRLIYALPAFSGLVQQADRDRINALLRKGKRWVLRRKILTMTSWLQLLTVASGARSMTIGIACTIYSPRKNLKLIMISNQGIKSFSSPWFITKNWTIHSFTEQIFNHDFVLIAIFMHRIV